MADAPSESDAVAHRVAVAAWRWIADTGCICPDDVVLDGLEDHDRTCAGYLEHLLRLAAMPVDSGPSQGQS